MALPPVTLVRRFGAHRLIPSRHLPGGGTVLAAIADDAAHLQAILELDDATNDRMLAEHQKDRRRPAPPPIGLFYDTMDLRPDLPFLVNRIWAEKSAYRDAGRETNLPALLHGAYRAEAYDAMRRWRGGEEEGREEPG